jgi:hypothetical protein
MFSSNSQAELDLLKRKVNQLDFDLKWPKLAIDTHCSDLIAKIDFQAEFMIKKINEETFKFGQRSRRAQGAVVSRSRRGNRQSSGGRINIERSQRVHREQIARGRFDSTAIGEG